MDMLDHLNVDKYLISDNELKKINGGAINLSGTLLASLVKTFTTSLDIGRSFGTALRRIFGKNICPIK